MTFAKKMMTATAALALTAGAAFADEMKNPMVGGAEMFADKNIVENAVNSADHTTLVAAVKAAGLVDTLAGEGPFTVFAPTNDAFAELDMPLQGEEAQAARVAILREHIVPGFLTREDIAGAIDGAGGSGEMQTMGSNTLTFTKDGDTLVVASSDGTQARVSGTAISGANGTVFPVDGVLKSLDAPG